MPDRLITRRELAAKLGVTVEWTYRHLARHQDFPRAALPNRWSEAAIDIWITRRSDVRPFPRASDTLPDTLDWETVVRDRIAAIG
ncbi:MAG: hypothetical protein FD149_2508 [Rhodospirillaceae bacterium]|nr:MAG: hypothetical protein FD149_2508 [Rhodospirillaceae bacterium]